MPRGHAGRDDLLHEHLHLPEAAVAILQVHHQGQGVAQGALAHVLLAHPVGAGAHHARGLLGQLVAAERAHVRDPVLLQGVGVAAQVGRLEAGMGGQLHAARVVEPRREHERLLAQHPPQQRGGVLRGEAELGEALLGRLTGPGAAGADLRPARGRGFGAAGIAGRRAIRLG